LKPSQIITRSSVENALRVLLALGGSTNAIIHLAAVAGRRGIDVPLTWLNTLSDTTPVLVNLKPVGAQPLLNLDCMTVSGETLGGKD
jgi:dihydroxy-acid dehydratase